MPFPISLFMPFPSGPTRTVSRPREAEDGWSGRRREAEDGWSGGGKAAEDGERRRIAVWAQEATNRERHPWKAFYIHGML